MTGPEHYHEAERLAKHAHHFTYGDGADPVVGAALAAEAQVHATLALTAATVEAAANAAIAADINSITIDRWLDVTHKPTGGADRG